MWAFRRQLLIVILCALTLGSPIGILAACGGTASLADVPQASPSLSAGADLVLFARPRLIAAAGLDRSQRGVSSGIVHTQAYDSGEDLLVDLAAGVRADVVEVCSDESAERLARQGLLRPLDTSRIAQWDRLYPVLKDLPGVVVDGTVYMVPLTASVTGIVYDPSDAPAPPNSFDDLFSPRYRGHLGVADDAALAFLIAALDLGLPHPSALTADQTLEAEIHLKHYAKNVRSFWRDVDNLASAFRSGHVTIAVGDGRAALQLERRGAPVAFTLASEGQPVATCGLAITTQARDLDGAYALIDYLLRPGTQAAVATATGDLAANRDAIAVVGPADRVRLGIVDLAHLERPVARIPELEHIDWIQAWYEVKMGRG
jgi:spermidine/putrescine transport system substrate-binding protein